MSRSEQTTLGSVKICMTSAHKKWKAIKDVFFFCSRVNLTIPLGKSTLLTKLGLGLIKIKKIISHLFIELSRPLKKSKVSTSR